MNAPKRTVRTVTTTTVRHTAKPYGERRESGVHLHDLRAFVEACEGLPDGALVRFDKRSMDEGARHDVEISTSVNVDGAA